MKSEPTYNQLIDSLVILGHSGWEEYFDYVDNGTEYPDLVIKYLHINDEDKNIIIPYEHTYLLSHDLKKRTMARYRPFAITPWALAYVYWTTGEPWHHYIDDKYKKDPNYPEEMTKQLSLDKKEFSNWVDHYVQIKEVPQNNKASKTGPTLQQLKDLIQLKMYVDENINISIYNHETNKHDLEIPVPQIRINDMWHWGCGDLEDLPWELVNDLKQKYLHLKKLYPYNHDDYNEDHEAYTKFRDEWEMCQLGLCSILRGSEPQNWIDNYKHDENDEYRKMNDEEMQRYQAHKQEWRTICLDFKIPNDKDKI
jgi:hypothetical protein